MTLRDGKFYNDHGQVVPLEFGNKQQVAILKRVDTLAREGEEFYIDFDSGSTVEDMTFKLTCVCGEFVRFKGSEEMDGLQKKCSCGLTYVCHEDQECYVTVKLKRKNTK
jgi:hypothetical protein